MACANCLHDDLLKDEAKIKQLKIQFSQQAQACGWDSYAIVKCSCKEGYAWRPVKHPDCKEYGVVEYCIC